jgi:hypothetical protein
MSDRDIHLATATELMTAEYLQYHGIIKAQSVCPCGRIRKLTVKKQNAVFRCTGPQCRNRGTVSVRADSEFLERFLNAVATAYPQQ